MAKNAATEVVKVTSWASAEDHENSALESSTFPRITEDDQAAKMMDILNTTHVHKDLQAAAKEALYLLQLLPPKWPSRFKQYKNLIKTLYQHTPSHLTHMMSTQYSLMTQLMIETQIMIEVHHFIRLTKPF